MIHSLFFEEINFKPENYGERTLYREAMQLACEHLMDTLYMEFNEADVINHAEIVVDYKAGTVLVPCNMVYKPEYMQ